MLGLGYGVIHVTQLAIAKVDADIVDDEPRTAIDHWSPSSRTGYGASPSERLYIGRVNRVFVIQAKVPVRVRALVALGERSPKSYCEDPRISAKRDAICRMSLLVRAAAMATATPCQP